MRENVRAHSGNIEGSFELNWDTQRWTCSESFTEGDFPFVAQVRDRRYELYSDGTFNEQEPVPDESGAARL